jgi:hypothetical protein
LELRARESGWFARLASPLTTTILAGSLTLLASVLVTYFQGRNTADLERDKFKFSKEQDTDKFKFTKELETQKQEHELILKMISVGDVEQARKNLEFIVSTKLITNKTLADEILKSKATPVLPAATGPSPDRFSPSCDRAKPSDFTSGLFHADDALLYVESCAVQEGASSYFYNYRVQNRGSKPVSFNWPAAGIVAGPTNPLQPDQSAYRRIAVISPPRIEHGEIQVGLNSSRASFSTVLPSSGWHAGDGVGPGLSPK